MSDFNLLASANQYFNNDIVGKASAYLGESEGAISKIIATTLPSLIGTIADKATASPDSGKAVIELAMEQSDSGILNNLGQYLGGEGGNDLLGKSSRIIKSLFGNDGDSNMLTTLISKYSGAKGSSVGTIVSMAVPALLGLIGNYAKANSSTAATLGTMLAEQKPMAIATLPTDFGATAPTVQAPVQAAKAEVADAHTQVVEKTSGLSTILIPFIILAAIVLGAWYFFKDGCNKIKTTAANTTDSLVNKAATQTDSVFNYVKSANGALDTLTGDFNYNEGELTTIVLPNGAGELKVGSMSTEAKLIAFLNDKNALIDTAKGNWYECTNVHFKTGGAELTELSASQLKNMVAIAKAYPNAKFKFGGYTDNTGNANKNITLSQKRAEAVTAVVKRLGAMASFEEAKGYGDKYPIGDNATPEGKAMNRRVAVNVKAK